MCLRTCWARSNDLWLKGVFAPESGEAGVRPCFFFVDHPHNSNPRPASAAALLKQEEAATSAAGALDADSSGSDATAE